MNILFNETYLYRIMTDFAEWSFGNANCLYVKAFRFPVYSVCFIPAMIFGIVLDLFFIVYKNN
jgi:hypothetical protein